HTPDHATPYNAPGHHSHHQGVRGSKIPRVKLTVKRPTVSAEQPHPDGEWVAGDRYTVERNVDRIGRRGGWVEGRRVAPVTLVRHAERTHVAHRDLHLVSPVSHRVPLGIGH